MRTSTKNLLVEAMIVLCLFGILMTSGCSKAWEVTFEGPTVTLQSFDPEENNGEVVNSRYSVRKVIAPFYDEPQSETELAYQRWLEIKKQRDAALALK